MNTSQAMHEERESHENESAAVRGPLRLALLLGVASVLLLGGTACKTGSAANFAELKKREAQAAPIVLREGDALRIAFPGAPNLNTAQQIRRDGRVTLPIVGEFHAAGMTPADMEKELVKLYGAELQTKEVSVTVEASAFPIYLTGAVLRPGRINADRPLTALEAVMEGGVDYNRANLKAVRVIRSQDGKTDTITLNLKRILDGTASDDFKLRPQDIVYVPEKFSWF